MNLWQPKCILASSMISYVMRFTWWSITSSVKVSGNGGSYVPLSSQTFLQFSQSTSLVLKQRGLCKFNLGLSRLIVISIPSWAVLVRSSGVIAQEIKSIPRLAVISTALLPLLLWQVSAPVFWITKSLLPIISCSFLPILLLNLVLSSQSWFLLLKSPRMMALGLLTFKSWLSTWSKWS